MYTLWSILPWHLNTHSYKQPPFWLIFHKDPNTWIISPTLQLVPWSCLGASLEYSNNRRDDFHHAKWMLVFAAFKLVIDLQTLIPAFCFLTWRCIVKDLQGFLHYLTNGNVSINWAFLKYGKWKNKKCFTFLKESNWTCISFFFFFPLAKFMEELTSELFKNVFFI